MYKNFRVSWGYTYNYDFLTDIYIYTPIFSIFLKDVQMQMLQNNHHICWTKIQERLQVNTH